MEILITGAKGKYLFIGKFGAILYGYPGTTKDIDIRVR
jgi:hypothetical protein